MQFLLWKNFPKIWRFCKILNFLLKSLYILKFFEFRHTEIAVFFATLFYVYGLNLVFVSCKSNALRCFIWNNFFTKTSEHDLSLTSITFDLGWPRIQFFQRMRIIDARRGTENFKALFPTEFGLLTKTHQGALWPPSSGCGLNHWDEACLLWTVMAVLMMMSSVLSASVVPFPPSSRSQQLKHCQPILRTTLTTWTIFMQLLTLFTGLCWLWTYIKPADQTAWALEFCLSVPMISPFRLRRSVLYRSDRESFPRTGNALTSYRHV